VFATTKVRGEICFCVLNEELRKEEEPMLNYKIFHNKDNQSAINKLENQLGQQRVIKVNNNIVAIDYLGDSHEYIKTVKFANSVDLSQYLVTSKRFLELIKFIVRKDYNIENIKFVYPITLDSERFINKQLESIYASFEDPDLIEKHFGKLLEEIEWLAVDGCIDIKSISFDFQSTDGGKYKKITVYNNGVIVLQDETLVEEVKELLESMRLYY